MAEGEGGAGGGAAGGEAGGAGGGAAGGGGRSEVLNSGGAAGGAQGAQGAPGAQGAAPEFAALIPAEFKDKPWVKDVKDVKGLFARTDGLLTEMGKRPAGIPQDNASEAEWAVWNKAWGVPEKPEEYKLAEGTAEAPVDPKFQTGIKSVFHKASVSARQAKILEEGYNALNAQLAKEKGVAAETQDADFTKLAAETFGNRKDDALKGANLLIAKYAPPSMKPHVDKLSNENLIVLAGVIDGIRKEFISEDRLPTGGGVPAGMTAEQKQARGRELMGSKAYTDPFHPDHEKTKMEVQRLYGTAA